MTDKMIVCADMETIMREASAASDSVVVSLSTTGKMAIRVVDKADPPSLLILGRFCQRKPQDEQHQRKLVSTSYDSLGWLVG